MSHTLVSVLLPQDIPQWLHDNNTIHSYSASSPHGELTVLAQGLRLLTAYWNEDHSYPYLPRLLRTISSYINIQEGQRPLWWDAFIHGDSVPVLLIGTPFQVRIWEALTHIPRGETSTYGNIGKKVGIEKAYQAIGQAVGANPIAIAVPCHRVLPQSGDLGGYRWGPARKQALLDYEKQDIMA